jgi:hypothetical protein
MTSQIKQVQCTQSALLGLYEFGYETYPLPPEWDIRSPQYEVGKGRELEFDKKLATELLERWDFADGEILETIRQCDAYGQANIASARHVRDVIWNNARNKLWDCFETSLGQQGFEAIHKFELDWAEAIYRAPRTRGILYVSNFNNLGREPGLELNASSGIYLERVMDKVKDFFRENWKLPKPAE